LNSKISFYLQLELKIDLPEHSSSGAGVGSGVGIGVGLGVGIGVGLGVGKGTYSSPILQQVHVYSLRKPAVFTEVKVKLEPEN